MPIYVQGAYLSPTINKGASSISSSPQLPSLNSLHFPLNADDLYLKPSARQPPSNNNTKEFWGFEKTRNDFIFLKFWWILKQPYWLWRSLFGIRVWDIYREKILGLLRFILLKVGEQTIQLFGWFGLSIEFFRVFKMINKTSVILWVSS